MLLGCWLAGSVFMAWTAMVNFRTVDEVLQHPTPAASERFQKLGREESRMLLRHLVGEQNRKLFESWEVMQLLLGVGLTIHLLFATNANRLIFALGCVMVLLVAIMHWVLAPNIVAVGRSLEFHLASELANSRRVFQNLHRAYAILETVKILLGVVLAALLLRVGASHGPGKRFRKHVDLVEHTNDSRV